MKRKITWGELRLHLYYRLDVGHNLDTDVDKRRIARCIASYLHNEQEKHHDI